MNKPDFKSLRELVKAISETDAAFQSIYNDKDIQENNIRTLCSRIAGKEARKALSGLSADELKNAKAGIRAQALIDAGLKSQVKIMVGGAPITQAFADEIGADAYTADAASAATKAKELAEG